MTRDAAVEGIIVEEETLLVVGNIVEEASVADVDVTVRAVEDTGVMLIGIVVVVVVGVGVVGSSNRAPTKTQAQTKARI